MVEISIGGVGEFESAVADVVQGLVVDAEGLVGVLDELMDRESSVVGLDHRVRHLGRGHHRERRHDAVGVLLADLRDQQGAHSRSGSTAKRVSQLEALKLAYYSTFSRKLPKNSYFFVLGFLLSF